MKLEELFNIKQKERKTDFRKTPNQDNLDKKSSNKQSEIGHGYYAHVRNHKLDPFQVKKISLDPEPIKMDGYYEYIKMIVDDQIAQENPFAPRIYKIIRFKDEKFEKGKYIVDMERLEPLKDISDEEIKDCLDKLFEYDIYDEDEYVPTERRKFENILTRKLRAMASTGNPYSKDDNLNDLMNRINLLLHYNPKLRNDLHRDNYMFRRGKYGVQLVITDPLS